MLLETLFLVIHGSITMFEFLSTKTLFFSIARIKKIKTLLRKGLFSFAMEGKRFECFRVGWAY